MMETVIKIERMFIWILVLAGAFLIPSPAFSSVWQTLQGCALVDHPSNDGDSFRVRIPSGEKHAFRIYLVDAPEVSLQHSDRVMEQADYFGITPEQAIEVGVMASAFTRELLDGEFVVVTRWNRVYGGSRKYGRILVDGEDLAELLVANGLARIHGMRIQGRTQEKQARLRDLEEQAKAERLGAWGLGDPVGQARLTTR